jgi:serine/threonine protein kinase/Tol biopolymer transport system component
MDANRRRRVDEICDAALQFDGPERAAYIASECDGDAPLRAEVESLLAHEQAASGFLSVPQVFDAVRALAQHDRDLTGTRIGPYEVVAKLGEGGMGVVYRAHDTRLDRDVALKLVTHNDTAGGFARLRREARAAARLNHPNVCTVYEVAVAKDAACIAMEWIDGAPLSAAIPNNGWSANQVCAIGRQIAEALAHAHANGVTHRDLKSANVMLRSDGRVKVIDFGIADRALRPTDQTETHAALAPGLAGTLSYLAPELLKGSTPDARSDLWSLGVLLFEMATGRLPFAGSGAPRLAAAILRDPPPALPSSLTTALSTVIEQCLAKEPSDRPASAAAVAAVLEDAEQPHLNVRRRSLGTPALAAALAIAAIAVGTYLLWPNDQDSAAPMRFGNPKPVTTALGVEEFAAWSPDGRTLAYMASASGHLVDRWDVWVTQLSGGTPINRTDGFGQRNLFPLWSPDGSLISFWSDQDGGGCYVMPALGGSPRRITAATIFDPNPAEWSADGAHLSCVTGTLEQPVLATVSIETGTESGRIPLPGRGQRRMFVTRSPDGKRLALATASAGLDSDLAQLAVYEIGTATLHPLTDGRTKAWSPFWSRDGRSLYYIDVSGASLDLWEQRFMPAGGTDGPPRALTTGVGMRSATLSRDGTRLAYAIGRRVGNAYRVPFRHDRAATWAEAEQLTFDQASVQCMDLDTSGTRLAISSDRRGSFDLWTLPAAGGNLTQITSDASAEWCPAWSPDGVTLAFYAYRSGNRDVWTMPAGGGEWKQVTTNDGADLHPAWTPDGKSLLYLSNHGTTVGTFMSTLDGQSEHMVESAISGRISPVDHRFAVREIDGHISIVDLDGRHPRRSLTAQSETAPSWTTDGRQLLVRSASNRISAVNVDDGVERTLVDLSGRRGSLNVYGTPSDGKFVYFIWEENLGDIWTMEAQPSPSAGRR